MISPDPIQLTMLLGLLFYAGWSHLTNDEYIGKDFVPVPVEKPEYPDE